MLKMVVALTHQDGWMIAAKLQFVPLITPHSARGCKQFRAVCVGYALQMVDAGFLAAPEGRTGA